MSRGERDEYRGDVWYDEWRAGLPEGSISDDRIEQAHDAGQSAESLVRGECQRRADIQAARQAEEYRIEEERYCHEQEQQWNEVREEPGQ